MVRVARAPALVVVPWVLVACAGSSRPIELGDYGAFAPTLRVVDSRGSARLVVSLKRAANVAVLYVVPRCQATVVYPTRAMRGGSMLEAGEHAIEGDVVVAPGPGRATSSASPSTTHTAAPRSGAARRAVQAPSRLDWADIRPAEPPAYLLVIASAHTLRSERARASLVQLTLPANAADALRAAATLIRGNGGDADWSGIARAVESPWRRTCDVDEQAPVRH